jgi:general stress protein 26
MSRDRSDDASDELQRIAALIGRIGIGMLGTRARDGHWVSRPVEPKMIDGYFDGDLWVLTSASSHKVAEIKAHPRINIAFASPHDNSFVSVSGSATVRSDRARLARLWTPEQRVYYPAGLDDPDLTLVRMRVQTVEYWDGPSSWLGKAVRFALATATRDADAMGDNRTLRIGRGGRGVHVVHGNTRGDATRAGPAARTRKPPRR